MNAGKSLEIIKVANNYEELGKRVMCLVPEVDDRYERDMVTSRVGLSHKAYTYGRKNDFKNELFEGSYYFLVYADKIEEIKTICWCGRKATMVARIQDGKIIKQGDQIAIGGNDMYASLCRKHYNDGRLSADD